MVTFHMLEPASAGYQYTSSLGDPGDGAWWYSVATASGAPLPIFRTSPEVCCATCSGEPTRLGAVCGALPSSGVTATWDGLVITGGAATCGEGTACVGSGFAPPGDDVVTLCGGCLNSGSDAGIACVSVPFQYPSSSEVVGTLPAP